VKLGEKILVRLAAEELVTVVLRTAEEVVTVVLRGAEEVVTVELGEKILVSGRCRMYRTGGTPTPPLKLCIQLTGSLILYRGHQHVGVIKRDENSPQNG
jgi:hypothetical protein